MEVVLPRSRRRRVKPPRPQFWGALFWVAWDACFIGYDTLIALGAVGHHPPVGMVCGTLQGLALALLHWPWFRRELALWRKDNKS